MIQIFTPKSGSDAVKQEELPDFFTILFFVINFCFTNQLCFDLEIWTAWIRQRRENLNQYKYGPVNRSDFKLRYGILILVVWGKRLQISLVSRIFEICSFASNQLKAIAKKEGHQMESLLFISIPINVGKICCYYWFLINTSS